MVRTQIQLTEEQLEALRKLSASTGQSISGLVRQGVEYLTSQPRMRPGHQMERALRVAGRFSSGSIDGSTHHDRHLAEAFRR